MSSDLEGLLCQFRQISKTEREKGNYFEQLVRDFLGLDPRYAPQFIAIKSYSDWADEQGIDARDDGIDLVAENVDGGCTAIQCKFYAEDHSIQKKEIDSFFTASGKEPFTHRIIVDSTRADWSALAEKALDGQQITVQRIGLDQLEQSPIDWSRYQSGDCKLVEKKQLRPHQQEALDQVNAGLALADRGTILMACGTGKTFTSLKIAEQIAGEGKRVLFLVPSLALMSQTITEWSIESSLSMRAFAVCSDTKVGKRKKNQDDVIELSLHDLAYPATTKPEKLITQASPAETDKMTVVFATYQSIQVIADAQNNTKKTIANGTALPAFDLIICDEAHRTTGATLTNQDESHFLKIHDQSIINGNKRLYMTATPRIYADNARKKAEDEAIELASMDDPAKFGKVLYSLPFSAAVEQKLLTDYKVIVLAMNQDVVSHAVQRRLKSADGLKLDDTTKILGCYRALAKLDMRQDLVADPHPMRRAVAFCKTIASSKAVAREFTQVVDEYIESLESEQTAPLNCEVQHVDGSFNASKREERLTWLKASTDDRTCRILNNVRCLSEGVDVPSLDAVLFMHPRNSQIDVVQSVGRVMRRAEGKNLGYVILPVSIPSGVTPEEALNRSDEYKVVWQVLNALRSHDDRLDSDINKMRFGSDVSHRIEIVAAVDALPNTSDTDKKSDQSNIGSGSGIKEDDDSGDWGKSSPRQVEIPIELDEFSKAIQARIVKKCGTRLYWVDWANDIAKIAQQHISRISGIIKEEDSVERIAFDEFLEEIRDDLNESIGQDDAIEMLAQHLITKPVFDALFEGYNFAANNPVSQAMQKVLEALNEHNIDNEAETLERFYNDVRRRVSGIKEIEARQQIIIELYDKFFRNAFPRMTDRLGIVYTPIEVVDFIIHSINDVLKSEFNQTLGSKGVHIIDPFTGTGTFITRLLQSGLIAPEELAYKYKNEIHANEIILLAYYIAAINIEQVYHSQSQQFEPFNGICLTDTFQLYEKGDMVSRLLIDNSTRRERQKELDIRVIMGNPPYSAGQTSANDNNANVSYETLDNSIRDSYAKHSTAALKNALYDSYIRSIRWASDRVGDSGVIGFVSNASFIDSNTADGLRKCLAEEFSSIYIFHLRGNQRTSGELSREEGGKIFGSGSRAPIAITLLVKNPDSAQNGQIYLHDIGDYLSREAKLNKIRDFKSVEGISQANGWQKIEPDAHNDWVNQRDSSFDAFIKMGDKKAKGENTIFSNYSRGVMTSKDAWLYNFSKELLSANVNNMVDFYNSESTRGANLTKKELAELDVDTFLDNNPKKISWDGELKIRCIKGKQLKYAKQYLVIGLYRPFLKQWYYSEKFINLRLYQMPRIFPESGISSKVICVTGRGSTKEFCAFMSDTLPDLEMVSKGQCFPLKLYEKNTDASAGQADLAGSNDYIVRDGISDVGLKHFQSAYPAETIGKEDVFFYVYGLLHSAEYKNRYGDNLSKQLPRIPRVKEAVDFWIFSQAGRDLADLHVGYESVTPYQVEYREGQLLLDELQEADFRVTKMKFGKVRVDGKLVADKSTVVYNNKITMTEIPLAAYDYIVNGKSALEWVMERQAVTTDKKSGIVNDANNWAIETMGNPKYPLEVFQRVITVSLETMKIVNKLPKLEVFGEEIK